jgi:isopentenyl-diphosphate delta-isomerase
MVRPTTLCRIIAENFLEAWWQDLEQTLGSDKHVDTRSIHKIMT